MSEVPSVKAGFSSSRWPAIPGPREALLHAILDQFNESQWLSKKQLMALADQQRDVLAAHALSSVPAYQDYVGGSANKTWPALPVVTAADIQKRPNQFVPVSAFKKHGTLRKFEWRDERGASLAVLYSELSALYAEAVSLTAFQFAGFDFSKSLGRIVPGVQNVPQDWGLPVKTGRGSYCPAGLPAEEQLAWIEDAAIEYLSLEVGHLQRLLDSSPKKKRRFKKLEAVLVTAFEPPSPELKLSAEALFARPLHWTVIVRGFGTIATQCNEAGNFHLHLETLFPEVADEKGQPCKIGQQGRLLVTNLHNFAMPVLRFDTGFRAKLLKKCSCGRGLPAVSFE